MCPAHMNLGFHNCNDTWLFVQTIQFPVFLSSILNSLSIRVLCRAKYPFEYFPLKYHKFLLIFFSNFSLFYSHKGLMGATTPWYSLILKCLGRDHFLNVSEKEAQPPAANLTLTSIHLYCLLQNKQPRYLKLSFLN